MDEIFKNLTNKQYIILHNKTKYTTDEIINYVTSYKEHIKDALTHYLEINKQSTTIDGFCNFIINNVQLPQRIKSYTILPNVNSNYHPEYLMIDINKPSWEDVCVTSDKYERRLNIYQSPLYNNDNLRFLPSQTVGYRRSYAKPYLARAIELTQDSRNYFISDVKRKIPPNYNNNQVLIMPQFVTIMDKYKKNIPSYLYHKIVDRRCFINISDYYDLGKYIPQGELKYFDEILNFKQ